MLNIKKKTTLIIISLLFFCFVLKSNYVMAESITEHLDAVAGWSYDLNKNTSIATYIGNIIQYALSILGVLFLCFLVYAGFLWMTARGDDEQVGKSREIMRNAVVGLIIVLMSYALTFYVVSKLSSTTLNNQGGFNTTVPN